jgi:glycosyltransferase involved in cell wall biosynthesis
MRVLIYCRAFSPNVGGLEALMELFAAGAMARGHEVSVVTATPAAGARPMPYPVHRNPSFRTLRSLHAWADVVLLAGMSLRGLLASTVFRRPTVVSHHGLYRRPAATGLHRETLKVLLSALTTNICASGAIAKGVLGPAQVVPNAYDHDVFRLLPEIPRTSDLIFVGRLVSDKGVHCLLKALGILAQEGIRPGLTIVGDGPDRDSLRMAADSLGLGAQVTFVGFQDPHAVCRLLNAHKVLVVPSLWEGFGLVALEGIACGCLVVASDSGGLPEAVGPCGVVFPRSDHAALASVLRTLHVEGHWAAPDAAAAAQHLGSFQKAAFVDGYLRVLSAAR